MNTDFNLDHPAPSKYLAGSTVITAQRSSGNPFAVFLEQFRSMYQHRQLILVMLMRELKGTHQGMVLGRAWIVIRPLFRLAVYILIAGILTGGRVAGGLSGLDYALYVLSGMIPWTILVLAMEDAPSQIVSRQEVLKQIIYPLETIPLSSIGVSAAGALLMLAGYVVIAAIAGVLPWSALLLPVPLLVLVIGLIGCSWILSVAGVVLKDIKEVIGLSMGVLVYLSPVFLTEAGTNEQLWQIIQMNPLSHVVICFRDVLTGDAVHPWSWVIFLGSALMSAFAGALVINRAKLAIREYI